MMEIICFYNPDEENGYLGNWYLSEFEVNGIKFSSMEQFMMYRKALCFQDVETAYKILGTDDVAKIKKLGREVCGYNENVWNRVRQIIVYEGLKAKFSQNEECFNGLFLPKSLRVSQRYGIFKVYFCQNVQK